MPLVRAVLCISSDAIIKSAECDPQAPREPRAGLRKLITATPNASSGEGSSNNKLGVIMKTAFSFMAFALLAAQQAFAVQPTITHFPMDYDAIRSDFNCGFDVHVQMTGKGVGISYIDPQGTSHDFMAYPQLKSVLTNVSTGKSITLNVSGPLKITSSQDGFSYVQLGVTSWTVDPDTFPDAVPGLFYVKGRFELFVDANGVTTATRTGVKIALCPMLQ
jgi:hypothetical protein